MKGEMRGFYLICLRERKYHGVKGRKRIYDANNSVLLDTSGYWGKQYSAATLKKVYYSEDEK